MTAPLIELDRHGNLEVDVDGKSVTLSRDQLMVGLAIANDHAAKRLAAHLLGHYRHACQICRELGCAIPAHVRSLTKVTGAELRTRVDEALEWRPEMTRKAMAYHNGYTLRNQFEDAMRSTGSGERLLARVWKDTEARWVPPTKAEVTR